MLSPSAHLSFGLDTHPVSHSHVLLAAVLTRPSYLFEFNDPCIRFSGKIVKNVKGVV